MSASLLCDPADKSTYPETCRLASRIDVMSIRNKTRSELGWWFWFGNNIVEDDRLVLVGAIEGVGIEKAVTFRMASLDDYTSG